MQTKTPKLLSAKLKEKFDALLKFTANLLGVDSTLSDFDGFQSLDEDQAIQVLYVLYKTRQKDLGAEGIKCIYSLMQEIIAGDGQKEIAISPQSYLYIKELSEIINPSQLKNLDPIDAFLRNATESFSLYEPNLQNLPGQLGAYLAFIASTNSLYDGVEEEGRKKLISGLAKVVPYFLDNLSKIYQTIVQSPQLDYCIANTAIFLSFINDVLQFNKINLFFGLDFEKKLNELKDSLKKETKISQLLEAPKKLPIEKQTLASVSKSVSSSSTAIPSAVSLAIAAKLNCDNTFKTYFDAVSQSVSDSELPSYLKNFEEFQKLETAFLIQALYDNIAVKTNDTNVLDNIYFLVTKVVENTWISSESYEYIRLISVKSRELKGTKLTTIMTFIFETNIHTFVFEPLKDDASLDDITKEIKKCLQIIQKSSALCFGKESTEMEETALRGALPRLTRYLLASLQRARHLILKNPQSQSDLESISGCLEKMSATKGISTLFGASLSEALQNHERAISSIQQVGQFLAYDFSKAVEKKQEKSIIVWVQTHSKMGIELLTLRISDAFKYHYQVHSILALENNSKHLKTKMRESYKNFKENLCGYAKDFKFGNENNGALLAIFGVVLSGIDIYHFYDRLSKFKFQVEMKKIYESDKTTLNQYFCFYLEVLNYIPFFQDKEFNVKLNGIKQLSAKLIELQKIDDAHTKYFIREGAEKLLEYFVGKIIIPKPISVDLNSDQSIEKSPSLAKNIHEELLYLNELKNFYDAFLAMIRSISPKFDPSKAALNFVGNLELQKAAAEQQLRTIETALQKNELSFSAQKKASDIVSRVELIDKEIAVIENALEERLVPVPVSSFNSADKKNDDIEKPLEENSKEEKVSVLVPVSSFTSADKQNNVIEKPLAQNPKKDLNTLIAETIPVILVNFKLNAQGIFEIFSGAPEYKSCRYLNKLGALVKALKENFPNMLLNEPKTWVDLLHKVFSDKKRVFDHRALIFIIGVSYEEKKEYKIAKEFYSHCLKFSLFEIPTQENKDTYLITKKLIEEHLETCENEISFSRDFPSEPSSFSYRPIIPVIFVDNVGPKNSATAIKTDAEILPASLQKNFH